MSRLVPSGLKRPPFYRMLRQIKLPGGALTLSSVGYAALNAFVVLLFVERGWGGAAVAFTSVGAGFILARLLACLGAALTGAGYSLAFQGFGVEAVRRAPPQSRGAAMGCH